MNTSGHLMVCFAYTFSTAVLAIRKVLGWYMTEVESRIKTKAICSNVNQAEYNAYISFRKQAL